MIRSVIGIFIVAAALFDPQRTCSHAATPVRIGVPSPSVSYFPIIVAWKKGFFTQEGVQVEFVVMKPSIIPAAMVNGEIQFSGCSSCANSQSIINSLARCRAHCFTSFAAVLGNSPSITSPD